MHFKCVQNSETAVGDKCSILLMLIKYILVIRLLNTAVVRMFVFGSLVVSTCSLDKMVLAFHITKLKHTVLEVLCMLFRVCLKHVLLI